MRNTEADPDSGSASVMPADDEATRPAGPRTEQVAVVLVRHGETSWSLSGRHTGRTDVSLTCAGEAQAVAAGDLVRRLLGGLQPAVVISSPRRRALRTAELAGYSPDVVTDDAREWDYGDYEGLTSREITQRDPGWQIWSGAVPNGESIEDVTIRIDRLLELVAASRGSGPALVFSHGHASRCVGARWLGLPVSAGSYYGLGTGAACVLGYEHERPVLWHWNITAALSG